MAPQGLYIHVPFCLRKCAYCDFYSFVPGEGHFFAYTETLLQELENTELYLHSRPQLRTPLHSLYLGGGTPSLLPASELARILEKAERVFGLAGDCEITLEANPGEELPERLEDLYALGINRLSMGAQSFHDGLLQRLGRRHSAADIRQAVRQAWQVGFRNLSLDLIFGLPGERLADFCQDLEAALQLPISHLSFYSLQLEAGTVLGDALLADPADLPAEEEERAMYHLLMSELPARGFHPYEISNAAREGRASRHNCLYWRAEPYWAVGPAAASYVAGVRRHNVASFSAWQQAVTAGQAFAASDEESFIDGDEAARETMMLGFRLLDGVDFARFQRLFADDPRQRFAASLKKLNEEGLIELSASTAKLTPLGRDLANQVFLEFV